MTTCRQWTREDFRSFYRSLDRRLFLPDEMQSDAGLDAPLPIGHGQTISQPSLVLAMTVLLDPRADSRVLEIGTGSGYQTAFLARFARSVHTIERYADFSRAAQERLERLGLRNVTYRVGDGSRGWPDEAPFDRIMVSAAASRLPEELCDQLARRGRMVIPVGAKTGQQLILVQRDDKGTLSTQEIEAVRFVEFVGAYGWHAPEAP